MDINGQTRLLGILGARIEHSLSPLIHNYSAHCLKLNTVYVPFDLPGGFPSTGFFDAMWEAGAIGFNITAPFKQIAAGYFSPCSEASVNTVYRGEDGWVACSTDGEGFLLGLNEISPNPEEFDAVVVLGSGGAVAAILSSLVKRIPKVPKFVLSRREVFGGIWGESIIEEFHADKFGRLLDAFPHSLVIQGTSAPVKGISLSEFSDKLKYFPGVFVDITYGYKSDLYTKACELGVRSQDGLSMLIGQAILSQEKWWGEAMSYKRLAHFLDKHTRDLQAKQ